MFGSAQRSSKDDKESPSKKNKELKRDDKSSKLKKKSRDSESESEQSDESDSEAEATPKLRPANGEPKSEPRKENGAAMTSSTAPSETKTTTSLLPAGAKLLEIHDKQRICPADDFHGCPSHM